MALFVVAGCISFVTYGNYNVHLAENDNILSENVLALADGPIARAQPMETCYNSITTSEGETILLCATCSQVPDATNTWWSGTSRCPKD